MRRTERDRKGKWEYLTTTTTTMTMTMMLFGHTFYFCVSFFACFDHLGFGGGWQRFLPLILKDVSVQLGLVLLWHIREGGGCDP